MRRLLTAVLTLSTLVPTPARAAETVFDHGTFDELLCAHVAAGLVDYDAFQASPAFAGYLRRLAAFDPAGLPRAEPLAFWINAYNAYTIQLINRGPFGIRAYGGWMRDQ